MVDKRAEKRVQRTLCAEVVREETFQCVSTEVVDVSRGGLRVRTSSPVLTGEDVLLTFTLGAKQVDAVGYVARVIHGRRPSDDGMRYLGLKFTYVDAASAQVLADWLHAQGS